MKQIDVILGLAELYRRELTAEAQAFWRDAVKDIPVEELRAAVRTGMRDWRFMPSPAEVLERVALQRGEAIRRESVADNQEQHRINYSQSVRRAFNLPNGVRLLEHIDQRLKAGESIDAIVDSICGPADESREPRYHCHLCTDSGYVRIWHPIAMRAALNRQPVPPTWCSVACTCKAGDSKVAAPGAKNDKRQTYRYAADRMVRVTGNLDADLAALKSHIDRVWQSKKDPYLAQFEPARSEW